MIKGMVLILINILELVGIFHLWKWQSKNVHNVLLNILLNIVTFALVFLVVKSAAGVLGLL